MTQRHAARSRASSTTHTDAIVHAIAALEHQREAIAALERAIGTATTATEQPAVEGRG